MHNTTKVLWLAALLGCAISLRAQMLPRPQTPAAEGKRPPDFTLPDQNGKPFQLASTRGKRILLVFYRGYW